MNTTIEGQLEIDHERGVIWFHCNSGDLGRQLGTQTPLRICKLPPIPDPLTTQLDITFGYGVSWAKAPPPKPVNQVRERICLITDYLRVNGPTAAADIEQALKLSKGRVWYALKHGPFVQVEGARWTNAPNRSP